MPLAIVALASFIAFGNSLHNEFVRDDTAIILENPMVQSWAELPALLLSDYWSATRQNLDELYRPVVMVSYLLNYSLGGTDPFGYHVVNLLLHILVSFSVYCLGLHLRLSWQSALTAALFFSVHPLHTEAVDPVTGRADLLCTLGVLLSLNAYIAVDQQAILRPGIAVGSWGAFFLALLSKETGIVLLGLLLLYEMYVWDRNASWRVRLSRKGVLLLGYAVVAVVYLAIRWAVLGRMYREAVEIAFVDNPIAAAPWDLRVLNALLVSGRYLLLFVWPGALSTDYSYNAIPLASSVWDPRVLAPMAAWGGLVVLAGWSYVRGSRFSFFAVGYLLVTFLPVSNLLAPIGTIMGERLFYMPSVALCLLVGGMWQWVFHGDRMRLPLAVKTAAYAGVVLALAGFAVRTTVRNRDWSSSMRLWEAAGRVVPGSARVYNVRGVEALQDGRVSEAIDYMERALKIYPDYASHQQILAKSYGAALLRANRAKEAIPYLEQVGTRTTRWPDVFSNLGVAYLSQESWIKAEGAFRKAMALDINMLEAQKGLMLALRKQGRNLEALAVADEALARKSDFLGAHIHRAAALKALGRTKEAQEEMAIIQRMQNRPEVHSE